MKYFLLFFSCFTVLIASSQTPNDVGKAIFESFKKNDIACFRHFINDTAFKIIHLKDYNDWKLTVDSNKASWNEFAKYFEIGDTITTENSFRKALLLRMKNEAEKSWLDNLKANKICNVFKVTSETYNVIKETEDEFEQKFLLIVNTIPKFAIRFIANNIGRKYFLEKIYYGLYFKDKKGEFKCTISCKDGKEDFRSCDL